MNGFGWKPDIGDIRDYAFSTKGGIRKTLSLPAKVDLRKRMPAVYDQGQLGSCTAHAVGGLCDYLYGPTKYEPSRLFLYYVTRSLEGTIQSDSGASIRDTIKAVNEFGVARTKFWPYNIDKFSQAPTEVAFGDALKHQALEYKRVDQNLDLMRQCLALKFPIAFGFSVYQNFYDIDNKNYILKPPSPNLQLIGGHAVLIVGFDDSLQCFIVRNSWGKDWGNHGYFLMPYSFALNPQLCADFWTITLIERN